MNRPLILLTNDDGIESPGLRAAAEAVFDLGDLLIAAPRHQQSSMGRSLWGNRNDRLEPWDYEVHGRRLTAYACNAAPALTVLHALHVLCVARRPALVVAGINYGENLGCNVTLSGTVGAALEAASADVPALAMSLQTAVDSHYRHGEEDWTGAKYFTRFFADRLLREKMPPDVDVLNVNVPRGATADTPSKLTRLSRRSYFSIRMEAPGPHSCINDAQVGVYLDHAVIEPGSDIHALSIAGLVSVTPLSLDLTSRVDLGELERSLRG